MLRTSQLAKELQALGIETPPRPTPPFEVIPLDPTPDELARDREYQAQCAAWIAAIADLRLKHLASD